MAKCVVCAHLNAEAEHKKRSIALNTVIENGAVRRGNHKPTQILANSLRERRKQYDPKRHPQMFCSAHGGPNCTAKNGLVPSSK